MLSQRSNVIARICNCIKLISSKFVLQGSNLLNITLDNFSFLEKVWWLAGEHGHSWRCSRHHKSTRWNSSPLAQEADQIVNAKDHIRRVGALHDLSIPLRLYFQILWTAYRRWRD